MSQVTPHSNWLKWYSISSTEKTRRVCIGCVCVMYGIENARQKVLLLRLLLLKEIRPHSSSRKAWSTDTQECPQTGKVCRPKGFSEHICHHWVDDALNSMRHIILVLQSKCRDLLSVRPWGCSVDRKCRRGDTPASTDRLSTGSA